MTTPEDKFEYTVEAMRRFFVEERQRAADSQGAKRYGLMDENIKKLASGGRRTPLARAPVEFYGIVRPGPPEGGPSANAVLLVATG